MFNNYIIPLLMIALFLGIFFQKLIGQSSNTFENSSELITLTIGYHGCGLGLTFYKLIDNKVSADIRYNKLTNKKEVLEFIKYNNMCIGDSFKCRIKSSGELFSFEELSEPIHNRKVNDTYEIRIRKIRSEQLSASEAIYKDIEDIFSEDNIDIEGTYKIIEVTDLNDDVGDLLWIEQ